MMMVDAIGAPNELGCPKAIPTVYGGVQFKSRMEAQCALLFDRFSVKWRYEPESYLLPSGINFMPDFYLYDLHTYFECRGYHTERSDAQVCEFGELIVSAEAFRLSKFICLQENNIQVYKRPLECALDGLLLVYCDCCRLWIFLGLGESCCSRCRSHGCSVSCAAVISARAGKILINGKNLEDQEAS